MTGVVLMSSVEPNYERELREALARKFVNFLLNNNDPMAATLTERAQQYADAAMDVLRSEVDNAISWGVGCAGCAHYLDRLYGEFVRGELSGMRWYSRRLAEAILDMKQKATEAGNDIRARTLTLVLAKAVSILEAQQRTAGRSFEDSLNNPQLPD